MKFSWICLTPVFLAACSSVSVNSTSKEAGYEAGPLTNIAVRVIDHDPIVGAALEATFCEELRKNGVTASRLPATTSLQAPAQDEDSPARVAQPGTQAILVVREGDSQLTKVQSGEIGRGDRSVGPDPATRRRTLTAAHDIQIWEADVFTITGGKPIWTGTVEVRLEELDDRAEKLKPCAKAIVTRLKLDSMIASGLH